MSAKVLKCNNWHKIGHFARLCPGKTENTRKQRLNYLEATHSKEEESGAEEIQQITQINRILTDKNDNCGIKLKINEKYRNFTIDSGSPVTILPNNLKLNNQKEIQPLKERYQDLNKTEIKFLGKIRANIEYNDKFTKLPIFITQSNDITPLLCMNWLNQLPITINKILLDEPNNQTNDIHKKFHKLLETNHTIKNAEVKIQIGPR